MTTLPPEGQHGQGTGGEPTSDPSTAAPAAPTAPPAAPQPPQAPPVQQHQAPAAPPVPPQQPAQPQFQAPQAPPVPPQQPQQPGQPQYAAPQYGAPQAGQTPPPGGYAQPGYAQPVADPTSNVTLNYWLSVFFTWIPALIFFFVDKDKGDQRLYLYQRENLNFSLLRTGVYLAIVIASFIPYVNLVLVPLLWIAQIVGFVFHIIAAVKASDGFRRGEQPGFIFNIPLVK
ncbi:DUF4870 domain-containing protein [Leucobacter musarum]|uniref:DUF4870 domain-containing protein n=1 Tax=Leucobacter musarum TaxID=1930747 RepID=UPI0006A7C4E6|nr:DUF4870 domain-containing protein [Leucobacter musarum]